MTVIGYARVSTTDQDLDVQTGRLKAAGCEIIRSEKVSGKSLEGRDELATVVDFIRAGDTLVVVKLDRLGRSTRDVLNLVHELEQKGVPAFFRQVIARENQDERLRQHQPVCEVFRPLLAAHERRVEPSTHELPAKSGEYWLAAVR
jgi:DNA invertase Pin-like site-specific DNA recombinase